MLSGDRLTSAQIDGLETWLEHVDPDDPVRMPQLVIDAVQALVEEVCERRARVKLDRRRSKP